MSFGLCHPGSLDVFMIQFRRDAQFITLALNAALCFLFTNCTTPEPTCVRNSDCTTGLECRLGVCRTPGTVTPDAGRSDGGENDGGLQCAVPGRCTLSEPCRVAADCISQFCSEGVCCDSKCSSPCATCKLAGSEGICKPKSKGTACDAAYVCDGTQLSCPSSCTAASDCAASTTCCIAARNGKYDKCVDKGLEGKCFELPACSSVADTFSGTDLDDTKWISGSSRPDGGSVRVANGQVALTLAQPIGSKDMYTAIGLKKNLSLVGSSCMVEVGDVSSLDEPASVSESGLVLILEDDSGSFVFRVLGNSKLIAYESVTNKPNVPIVSTNPIPTAARRFLRVRDNAGTLVFEYSKDGKAFTTHATIQPTLRLSDVFLNLVTTKDEIRRDGGYTIAYDNLNIVP
jgi:hypothetical protein